MQSLCSGRGRERAKVEERESNDNYRGMCGWDEFRDIHKTKGLKGSCNKDLILAGFTRWATEQYVWLREGNLQDLDGIWGGDLALLETEHTSCVVCKSSLFWCCSPLTCSSGGSWNKMSDKYFSIFFWKCTWNDVQMSSNVSYGVPKHDDKHPD